MLLSQTLQIQGRPARVCSEAHRVPMTGEAWPWMLLPGKMDPRALDGSLRGEIRAGTHLSLVQISWPLAHSDRQHAWKDVSLFL